MCMDCGIFVTTFIWLRDFVVIYTMNQNKILLYTKQKQYRVDTVTLQTGEKPRIFPDHSVPFPFRFN